MTVCNVGDSRALLGRKVENGSILPIPLTRDQTPYRRDERERVKKEGAEIKSIDQLKGREPMHDDWGDMVHGEIVNIKGDPPRVWVKGNDFPGSAFTRSIGDRVAENIGVIADPEIETKNLTENDKFLVIASDGVFEFLTNKQVMAIVEKCADPVEACKAVHEAAYEQWEEHENRTDDITVIVCFLSNSFTPPPADAACEKGTHLVVQNGEDLCGMDICLAGE
jgi:serine/threonine protein phosphatase PrpC